jgi:putative ABC transport system permease protein
LDVLRLVLGQGIRGIALGILAGVTISYAVTRILASVLYGVTATDPITFAAVIVLLIIVALAASTLPARRAIKLDPAATLRHD